MLKPWQFSRRTLGLMRLQLWVGLLIVVSLAGCSDQQPQPDQQVLQDAQATIVALSTENARLATAVGALTPVAVPQVPVATATSELVTEQPVLSPTQVITAATVVTTAVALPAPARSATGFPTVLADIPLGTELATLVDFRRDQAANRLYVTDESQLYVLDASSYQVLNTLPVGGRLTLDAAAGRLFVAPAVMTQEPGAITVVDTQQVTITGVISGATHLSLDSDQQRIFVGHEQESLGEQRGAPMQTLDAATLAPQSVSPHYGIPIYNSQRAELLLVNSSVWVIDPTTWELKQDLLPEITQQECVNCVGALQATEALLFPAADVLALSVLRRTSSGGPGVVPEPQFLQASTLEPLADPKLALQPTCGTQPLLRPVVNGASYHTLHFMRYTSSYNLLVKDSTGNLSTWRDGISDPFINVTTAQAYADNLVLDLPGLTPMGGLPTFCVFAHDTSQGLLYGARQNHLLVIGEQGGQPLLAANEDAILPALPIRQVVASPAFTQDNRLFVINEASTSHNELYRSSDGGQTWMKLRQGLPPLNYAHLTLALSPAFTTDQTLFLGGAFGDGRGLGVYRSTNGGDSWQPMWQGLMHLRVNDVVVSPNFAQDQTVLALAAYNWWSAPFDEGYSAQRSTDGGLTWTLALTTPTEIRSLLPELLPELAPLATLPVRRGREAQTLERTLDGGQNWQPLDLHPPADNLIQALVPTADYQTLYILGSRGLWRVRNQGAIVESWVAEQLQTLTVTNTLTALTLAGAADQQRLILGTSLGQLWPLDPATLNWQLHSDDSDAIVLATPTPAAQPVITATVAATPTVADQPPAGLYRPQGAFATDWARDPARQQLLGWAKSVEAQSSPAALQTFETGLMFWRGDEAAIYVLYGDNSWQRFPDTFQEGEAESDPSLAPPDGKLQPIRGFGKIWREEAGVRAGLGWATGFEQGFEANLQDFEHGLFLRNGGLVYVLIEQEDGRRTWLVL